MATASNTGPDAGAPGEGGDSGRPPGKGGTEPVGGGVPLLGWVWWSWEARDTGILRGEVVVVGRVADCSTDTGAFPGLYECQKQVRNTLSLLSKAKLLLLMGSQARPLLMPLTSTLTAYQPQTHA